jgi:hypothetical protein
MAGGGWAGRPTLSFLRQVCGLELPGDLWAREATLARAEAAAGWWWPHRRFCESLGAVLGDRCQASASGITT